MRCPVTYQGAWSDAGCWLRVRVPAPPLLLLLLAPDQPITTGELLAVALDDEPEDTEPDADKAEADAQCQVAGRGGDHPGAAAVVVLTQDPRGQRRGSGEASGSERSGSRQDPGLSYEMKNKMTARIVGF